MKQTYPDSRPLFAAYWRALDTGDLAAAELMVVEILASLGDQLHSMARKAANQLHSPLAEVSDLVSEMQIEVLQALPMMPRTINNPAAYLVTTAQHRLFDVLCKTVPATHEMSLDAPLTSDSDDPFTLLQTLPMPEQRLEAEPEAILSPALAALLDQLKPCQQLAIQVRYQFDNWEPRRGQRKPIYRRDNLYHAMSALREIAGVPRPQRAGQS